MADFEKYVYEEVYRYFEFKRDDGKDGLLSDETLSSHAVTCADAAGTDCTAAMISDTSIVEDTKVKYKLKAGTAGTTYYVTVKVVTSTGQKFEGVVEIGVVA